MPPASTATIAPIFNTAGMVTPTARQLLIVPPVAYPTIPPYLLHVVSPSESMKVTELVQFETEPLPAPTIPP